MDLDFGRHHGHPYPYHPGFGGLHEGLEWLPLVAGLLATVAIAGILLIALGGEQVDPIPRMAGQERAPDPVRRRWHDAMRSLAATAREFAAYECTPAAVLQHPDLADVTRPATAQFIDAFAEANALATENYPGVEHATRFTYAAQRAQGAWRTAVDAAQTSGVAGFTPGQRVRIDKTLPPRAVFEGNPSESERRSVHHQPRHRLVQHEWHTGWISTTPGRHRAREAGSQHGLFQDL